MTAATPPIIQDGQRLDSGTIPSDAAAMACRTIRRITAGTTGCSSHRRAAVTTSSAGDHRGVLFSPNTIDIPACGTSELSFSYFLDTRHELGVDFVEVQVDDGTSITTVLSRQDGTLPETDHRPAGHGTVRLTPFAGKRIQLQFLFDTGAMPMVDPEGWYVDDIRITNLCAPVETDLAIDKRDDGSDAVAGTNYTYTLEVTNWARRIRAGRRSQTHCQRTGVRLFVQSDLRRQRERSGNGDLYGRSARSGAAPASRSRRPCHPATT